jgi:hypothetical protein
MRGGRTQLVDRAGGTGLKLEAAKVIEGICLICNVLGN